MHPRDALAAFLTAYGIGPSHILLALSGGVDSTALALAAAPLRDSGFNLSAAHVNHRLRGTDSDQDELFVRSLCTRLGLPLVVRHGPLDPGRIRDTGLEAAAREVRYAALRQVRDELGADWIATAHQKNDQAETVLTRLISGSGVGRLRGIRPRTNDRVIRPLLESSRKEIELFLAAEGVAARLDRSNLDPRHLRNRIRQELLPLLEEYNPRMVETLAETARQAREQSEAVDALLESSVASALTRSEGESRIDLTALLPASWILQTLIAREARRIDPAARSLSSADIRRLAAGALRLRKETISREAEILRKGSHLILRRKPVARTAFDAFLGPGQATVIDSIRARVRIDRVVPPVAVPDSASPVRQRIQLPSGALAEFRLRSRRTGDRFTPLGLQVSKKLSEVLTDRKVPLEVRDSVPLLVCGGEIAWVAGVEVSERFKVADPSREAWEVLIEYWE